VHQLTASPCFCVCFLQSIMPALPCSSTLHFFPSLRLLRKSARTFLPGFFPETFPRISFTPPFRLIGPVLHTTFPPLPAFFPSSFLHFPPSDSRRTRGFFVTPGTTRAADGFRTAPSRWTEILPATGHVLGGLPENICDKLFFFFLTLFLAFPVKARGSRSPPTLWALRFRRIAGAG